MSDGIATVPSRGQIRRPIPEEPMTSRADIPRRSFLTTLALTTASLALAPGLRAAPGRTRRLRRVGVQLYSLRDDAKKDLERTLADIAAAGYQDVEVLGSMNNFGMPPKKMRAVLDRNGLRAPSTHIDGDALDHLDRQLDDAKILGHE